jgi:iron complex transport system substrate-binding protein
VPVGRHTPEFLLSRPIDVFIATASGTRAEFERGRAMVVLGGDTAPDFARLSFEKAVADPVMQGVPAIREGRAYAIWHNFYNSPHNLYVIERFAKWLHPDLFRDVDPEATLAEQFARFTPFRLEGTFAIALREKPGG